MFTWICSGSKEGPSPCSNISKQEVGTYHGSGVPYLAHKDDWEEWLADSWKDCTARCHLSRAESGPCRSEANLYAIVAQA